MCYSTKIGVIFSTFLITLTSGTYCTLKFYLCSNYHAHVFSAEDVVRVGMPIGYITDYYPQWYWDNKTQSYRGFFIDYLDEIFNLLEPDMKYELVENNFTYAELVDALVDDKFDIIHGDIYMSSQRLDKIDFSVPIQSSNLIIIKRKITTQDTSYFSIFLPLSFEVWLAILTAILTGSQKNQT